MQRFLQIRKKVILLNCFMLSTVFSNQLLGQTQLTNLPTLYLTTTSGQAIVSKDVYVPGTLTVVASEETTGKYNGPIEIRGRGNATWQMPKKPYKIKLDSKTNLLGLPSKENKWVLLANYKDNTLIKNCLAFEISKFMEFPFTPAYQLVDVFLNGAYQGNYMLTDQVEKGNNRVSLDKLDNTNNTEPILTGGYLLQAEIYADEEPRNFRSGQAMAMSVKYPDSDDISTEQFEYIKNYFNSYESKLYSNGALDPVSGYRPMNDRASQVNWYIATELTGNPDSFLSIFMYKQRNDPKIYFGPMWDYDGAFGTYSSYLGNTTYKRMSSEAQGNGFPDQMLKDPEFIAAIKTRWNELKTAGLAQHLDDKIVALYNEISASQIQNKTVWNYDNPTSIPNYNSKPYLEFITDLRAYVKTRIAYLDQQFNDQIRTDIYYKLLNRANPKVIDLNNTGLLAVSQTESTSPLSQQWLFVPIEVDGVTYYRIQNRESSKYLTAPSLNNEQLKLTSDPQVDAQLWSPVGANRNAHYGFTNKYSSRSIQNPDRDDVTQSSQAVANQSQLQWTLIPYAINPAALPVKVVGLEALGLESRVKLSWKVTENVNGEKFVIQRSTAPSKFLPDSIGQVFLRESGAGSYEFYDLNAKPGLNYYRLKMVDIDGTVEYTRYVSANNVTIQNINVYPQPAANTTNIAFTSLTETSAKIEIFNAIGRKITDLPIQAQRGQNHCIIDTKNYSTGVYEIRFTVDNQISSKKLLVFSE
jgi:hypothetical protein